MDDLVYPVFRVITGVLNVDGAHDEYDEVMQDVYVTRSGRYRIVTNAKTSIDPKTGDMHVMVEIVDNGPESERAMKF